MIEDAILHDVLLVEAALFKFLFVLARAVRDPVPKFECSVETEQRMRGNFCAEFLSEFLNLGANISI